LPLAFGKRQTATVEVIVATALQQAADPSPAELDVELGGAGTEPRAPLAPSPVAGASVDASLLELRQAVRRSCRGEERWEAKVVAAIGATLVFCAVEPARARALATWSRCSEPDDRGSEWALVALLAGELNAIVPAGRRVPYPSVEAVVASMVAVVRGHLIADDPEDLLGCAPDLVGLVLMPYLEFSQVTRWAESAVPSAAGDRA
jgi:hypothetical protein